MDEQIENRRSRRGQPVAVAIEDLDEDVRPWRSFSYWKTANSPRAKYKT